MSTINKINIKMFPKDTKQKFSLLVGINRPIRPSHVTEMTKSVREMGCIRPIIIASLNFIDGVKRLYIIDGQHLFQALMKLDLDIPTVEVDVTDMQDLIHTISILNNTSKSWILEDYITAWANLAENKSYKRLQDLRKKHSMNYTLIAMAMNTSLESGGVLKLIKRGNFKVEDEKLGTEILNEISQLRNYVPKGFMSSFKTFMSAFIKLYKDKRDVYNQAKMVKFITDNIYDITNTYSPSECYTLLKKVKF